MHIVKGWWYRKPNECWALDEQMFPIYLFYGTYCMLELSTTVFVATPYQWISSQFIRKETITPLLSVSVYHIGFGAFSILMWFVLSDLKSMLLTMLLWLMYDLHSCPPHLFSPKSYVSWSNLMSVICWFFKCQLHSKFFFKHMVARGKLQFCVVWFGGIESAIGSHACLLT